MRHGGRAALVALVVSLAVLASVAGIWFTGGSGEGRAAPSDAGSLAALESPAGAGATGPEADAAPVTTAADATPPTPTETAPTHTETTPAAASPPATKKVGAVAGVQVHDARVGEQLVEQVLPPVRIRVPALGVDAAVQSMGIEPTGEMELPTDPATVGWYGYGPTPGEPGSSVVAGHVDGDGRPGAFFRLGELAPGQRLTVTSSDGSSRAFRVTARRVFVKKSLPAPLIFRRTGRPVLTLVTCGGEFDRSTGHYESNIVVFATPV